MILISNNLGIEGVKLFDLNSQFDERGSFGEIHRSDSNYKHLKINFLQENESVSNKNVFRGMHFQKGKYSQSKLIRIIKGEIIDVVCDLRKSSKTFKKIIYINLIPSKLLFIPKGLAHGFFSLKDETILNYKCDEYYNSSSESGFNLFSSNLKIDFHYNKDEIIMSNKDKDLPDFDKSYIYEDL